MSLSPRQFAAAIIAKLRSPRSDNLAMSEIEQEEFELKDTLKSFSPSIRRAMKQGKFSLQDALYNENCLHYGLLTTICLDAK